MPLSARDSISTKVQWIDIPESELAANAERASSEAGEFYALWYAMEDAVRQYAQHACDTRQGVFSAPDARCDQWAVNEFSSVIRRKMKDFLHTNIPDTEENAANPDYFFSKPKLIPDFYLEDLLAHDVAGFKALYDQHVVPLKEQADRWRAYNPDYFNFPLFPHLFGKETSKELLQGMYDIRTLEHYVTLADPGDSFVRAIDREADFRSLMLKAWSSYMARQGHPFDAEALFRERSNQGGILVGNAGIFAADILPAIGIVTNAYAFYTKYGAPKDGYAFTVGFASHKAAGAVQRNCVFDRTAAFYLLDKRIMDALKRHGDDGLGEAILKSFHTIGTLANHDYVHNTVWPVQRPSSPFESDIVGRAPGENAWDKNMKWLEPYSVLTHAAIMRTLFAERPQVKEALLRQVIQFTENLSTLERRAAAAGEDASRAHAMGEFLLQQYMQRLFAFISPCDPALREPIGMPEGDPRSVAGAITRFGVTPFTPSLEKVFVTLQNCMENRSQAALLFSRPRTKEDEEYTSPTLTAAVVHYMRGAPTVPKQQLMEKALAGKYDDDYTVGMVESVKGWRELLKPYPDARNEFLPLHGLDAVRARALISEGGYSEMAHYTGKMAFGEEIVSPAEVTARYLDTFAGLEGPLGIEEGSTLGTAQTAMSRIHAAASAKHSLLTALHIPDLIGSTEQLRKACANANMDAADIERVESACDRFARNAERAARLLTVNPTASYRTRIAADLAADAERLERAAGLVDDKTGSQLKNKLKPHLSTLKRAPRLIAAASAGRRQDPASPPGR